MKSPKTMTVPIQLCSYSLEHKCVRPLQLYIDLKFRSKDIFKLNENLLLTLENDLNLKSRKTIIKNLMILVRLNWIGYNNKTGNFFIRGYDRVREMNHFSLRTGVEIEISDIKTFKAFVSGAVIGNLARNSRRRALARERSMGGSLQRAIKLPDYFPVANLAMSKILNISISTAWELKKIASDKGYIHLKKNFTDLNVGSKLGKRYKKVFPEDSHRVRVRKDQLWYQEPDTVKPLMGYRRRRKLTPLNIKA